MKDLVWALTRAVRTTSALVNEPEEVPRTRGRLGITVTGEINLVPMQFLFCARMLDLQIHRFSLLIQIVPTCQGEIEGRLNRVSLKAA